MLDGQSRHNASLVMPIDCENKEIEMQLDKVYNMDCMDLLPQIENESIDMIITDPPYTTPTVTAFGREDDARRTSGFDSRRFRHSRRRADRKTRNASQRCVTSRVPSS